MNVPSLIALCSSVIMGVVGVGNAVNLNKTEEVKQKVEQIETIEKAPSTAYNNYGVVNNYETHKHYEEVTKEVDKEEVKEMVHDAYFEERVKEAEETSNQLTYEELQALIYDGSKENAPTNSVDKCEVCERTGTELEAWYDVNNIKHYTCKERCTGGLDVLYGE